ncbi:MAG: hypothetical protein EBU52_16870, partial [Cytophagia bacterium]|nr:hypothetical protein [Cytophagia bacterium]
MKTVLLLLSTDRFAIPLIRYMVLEGKRYGWKTCIGTMFDSSFTDRIREEKISNDLIFISITDYRQCDAAIRKCDLVIGMVPDVMLLQIADSCINHRKPLVSPARLNRQLVARKAAAEENQTLILVECGFAPGIDHVTAKNVIDSIHVRGGTISSFKTYSGSLVAESSIDNPWEFKLTEPIADVLNMGKGTNRHIIRNQIQHVPQQKLFARQESILIKGIDNALVVPEDDSLYLKKTYDLKHAHTVMKGRIIRKGFDTLWHLLISLGFTNTTSKIELFENKTFLNYLRSLVQYKPEELLELSLKRQTGATAEDLEKLRWLGLFDESWPEGYREVTPASLLHFLMEQKLSLKAEDKDCIVMRHELDYTLGQYEHHFTATLVSQGEDRKNSALAKAIGLTTGAAARAILLDDIQLKGLHTPVTKKIYEPILTELLDLGVAFQVEERKVKRRETTYVPEMMH